MDITVAARRSRAQAFLGFAATFFRRLSPSRKTRAAIAAHWAEAMHYYSMLNRSGLWWRL